LTLLCIPLPTQRIVTTLSPNEFLFDFHVHTTASDGMLTPEERIDWYICQGINGSAFSDHDTPNGAIRAQEYVEKHNLNFTVFLAFEYTSDSPDIHLNVFGIDQAIVPEYASAPPSSLKMNVSDMIEYVKDHEGYVVVNHYDKNSSAPYSYEQLRDWGVDGFEIINEGENFSDEIRTFCLANSLALIGGSDYHTNSPLNTFVKLYLPDPTNKSLDAVFTELKKNTHQVIAMEPYAKPFVFDQESIEDLINYMFSLNPYQITSWVLWSYALYVLGCWIFKKAKYAKPQIHIKRNTEEIIK
jgi:hypothetical protein